MSGDLTKTLAEYVAGAAATALPADVENKARLHLLDTLAAGVSGSQLRPGRLAAVLGSASGRSGPCTVWGQQGGTDDTTAAMVNGMSAHADETDDSHAPSLSHPGCAVIPAAWAVAERAGASGAVLLRALAVGYDVGTRVVMAIGRDRFDLRAGNPSSHAYASLFGAAAAGAAAAGLSAEQVACAFSYTAQMCSGVTTWLRDTGHVEKAYVFGGMPAKNGVFATRIAAHGLDGVPDVFDGSPSFFDAIANNPRPETLVDGLGTRFELMRTNIKRYAVGSPAQAAVQAMEEIVADRPVSPGDVAAIEIQLPADLCNVVNDRAMPDINVQYLVAGTLIDGRFSFAMAHDSPRMADSMIGRIRERTTLVADEASAGTRSATVSITLTDGTDLRRYIPHVRGTTDDPMTVEEVRAKSSDLLQPILSRDGTTRLIDYLMEIDKAADLAAAAPLLAPA